MCWAGHFQGWALLNHLEKLQHPSNTLRGSRSWPGVLAIMGAGCASVKRAMLIQFPRLIFFFSLLVFRNTEGQPPSQGKQNHHHRRQQHETQEGAGFPNIWRPRLPWRAQPRERKKGLRSAGIKVCPGCLSGFGLPQYIQIGFPERSRRHKQSQEMRQVEEQSCVLSAQSKQRQGKAHGGIRRCLFS